MLHQNIGAIGENLSFAGCDTAALAKEYGTPLYLMDEARIRLRCREYRDTMREVFGEGSVPLYAGKACCFKEIYRIIGSEGICADVVSLGEIETALAAGFPAERLHFHGTSKSDFEIRYAMERGIGCFIIDSFEELYAVDRLASELGIKQKALLRLTPGIDPHTFEAVNTGKLDCQFGTPIETGQAREYVAQALKLQNIELEGYHCHIGSQIFNAQPFNDAADIMLRFAAMIRRDYGYVPQILDIGGGLGVRYVESDPLIDIPSCIREIGAHIKTECRELGLPMPKIYMEPGRSIVADAGLTLYSVSCIKNIDGYRSYVLVDGGMTDNPRYALYSSPYTIYTANKATQPADYLCTIAGRCCESDALIQENVRIAKPQRGDIIAVPVTGAYNYSMASNYNRVGRPCVVMLRDNTSRVAVEREAPAELSARDV